MIPPLGFLRRLQQTDEARHDSRRDQLHGDRIQGSVDRRVEEVETRREAGSIQGDVTGEGLVDVVEREDAVRIADLCLPRGVEQSGSSLPQRCACTPFGGVFESATFDSLNDT